MSDEFKTYFDSAPDIQEIHYWDLPKNLCVGFKRKIDKLKLYNQKSITIEKLKRTVGNDHEIEKEISFIYSWKTSISKFPIKLPLNFRNKHYVNLYSIMLSEGSFKTEFRLHVPEMFFHDMLVSCLKNLFGDYISNFAFQKFDRGFLRTTLPTFMRYFIPIPEYIPKFILKNPYFSKIYLRTAFEAEGSPILVGTKRYIRFTRSTDISKICQNLKEKYKIGSTIFFGKFKKEYPELANAIEERPPITLLGEHLLLKKHFNIESIIKPERIRFNKTNFRKGKITVRWALSIYSQSLDKFIKSIGFLSERKCEITKKMSKIKGRRRKFFSLEIIKRIQKNNIFTTKKFCKEMKRLGYVSPCTYLWRYEKKNIIHRFKQGIYEIDSNFID